MRFIFLPKPLRRALASAYLVSLIACLMMALALHSVNAAVKSDVQALDEISGTVEQYIRSELSQNENIEVAVKSLDNRLRLQQCDSALEPSWLQSSRQLGRVTVRVACLGPRPWRVNIQATVTMQSVVWTLIRTVSRGEILSEDMLVQKEVTLGENIAAFRSLGTPVLDFQPLLGFEFSQRINSGRVLNEGMLKPAKLIRKGDAVVIRHHSRGLQLQTRGVALSDAAAQQQIQVRNSSSGKIIDVIAVSTGAVETLQ